MKFEIRDESGHVFNTVTNPATIIDSVTGTRHRVGESKLIEVEYNAMRKAYIDAGLQSHADDLIFFELPKNQEHIDKVFQNTSYAKNLYDKTMNHVNK